MARYAKGYLSIHLLAGGHVYFQALKVFFKKAAVDIPCCLLYGNMVLNPLSEYRAHKMTEKEHAVS